MGSEHAATDRRKANELEEQRGCHDFEGWFASERLLWKRGAKLSM